MSDPYTLYLVVDTTTGHFLGARGRWQTIPKYWNKRNLAANAARRARWNRIIGKYVEESNSVAVVEVRAVEEQRWSVAELVKK